MEPLTTADRTQTPVALPEPHPRGGQILAPDMVLDGTYRIIKRLGEGGMGEVYVAAHERLPGLFAVKALQTSFIGHAEAVSRFRREAEILAGVRHPNVVQVVDFNVTPEGIPYLVMELADGPDLARELDEGRELSPADAMSIIRQIASALDAAHAAGVVHRDLKPANVILMPAAGQAPVVKVIDFGISISDWSPQITTESRVMGTPEFMSPEQALGKRDDIDARSDQFALAVLAHTLLARRPPFRGDTPLATLSAIVHGQPEALVPYVPWPGEEVQAVLRRGMARTRENRFPTVLAFAEALESALSFAGALAEPPRACPSASVAAPPSRSDPELAQVLAARRTPSSGSHRAADSDVIAKPTSPAASAAPNTEEVQVRRPRSGRVWVSLLALLIACGAGAAALRATQPRAFQRGVTLAGDLIQVGWSQAAPIVGRVPPLLHRARAALPF
jgi:eukaryotic-like serine/threonine-protein kinase